MDHVNIRTTPDGNMECTVPGDLTAVGIENIVDVLSHEITREAGATLHVIRYLNGGIMRFLYTDEGKIKDFSGGRISCVIVRDGQILLRRYEESTSSDISELDHSLSRSTVRKQI